MVTAEKRLDLEALNGLSCEELLAWALREHGERAGIITSFQTTGCVMIDMAERVARGMRVITVDTLRLHAETYDFMDEIENRYDIRIERFWPDEVRLARMIRLHGEFLFFDSQGKQEHCCQVRKVEPNERALDTLDVWFTGLRRDQSSHRQDLEKVSMVERDGRSIIKIAPLVDWPEEQIDAYIEQYDVPRNPLYAQGYASIGCDICTTPIRAGEDKRAGRWRWFNHMGDEHKKECGLHFNQGDGI